ncbi:RxLR-like protein [Plasmopara halstedii]|uniref:RxLR-like protein n=1 Tax=Plasmopara halstedii TaxID=4781 RepID=A0A0P1AYQ6_PLAHL|nr:RxLR-like protein [Plasmopara halstedii]CEG45976.1 RxLR-like protein [Plasmopara halstedii]|eukprot:XP_024582345.1 RxLR-like protein [Plasmopara halstedii]
MTHGQVHRNVFLMPRIPRAFVLVLACAAFAAIKALATEDLQELELEDHSHHGHELESDGLMVRCRACGALVAMKKDYIALHDTSKAVDSRHDAVLGDNADVYTFVNSQRTEFELVGFKKAVGLEGETYSKKSTFFDDYSWRDLRCKNCKKHVGWVFYHDEFRQCLESREWEDHRAVKSTEELSSTSMALENQGEIVHEELEGRCVLATFGWWTYEICYKKEVRQFHQEPDGSRPSDWSMGKYSQNSQDMADKEVLQYYSGGQHCDENGEMRSTIVLYSCCDARPKEITIEKVDEPALCMYLINVCVPRLCTVDTDVKQDGASAGSCQEQFDASHTNEALPSKFAALRWSSVISEDSSELDWARRMQIAI